jgi:glucose-1-phosphate adenylyltransferase
MDLCGVDPEFNLYDPSGRCGRISRRRRRRSSCSPNRAALRHGARLGHLARLHHLWQPASRQRLCPNVRVHSYGIIEQSMLMPGVRVGRHARIRRAIIDRDVLIPRGAVIGYNPEEDRKRHTVTDLGVVVVTEDDDPLVEPISEEALRIEAEDDGR